MTTERDWKPLYKTGGIALVAMVGIIIIQMFVFMTAPPPYEGSALDWFELFRANHLIGLVNFEVLMVIYVILSLLPTLALSVLHREASPSFVAIYLALSLVGVISFIAARPAFEMLSISNGYAAAATDMQRAPFLAAGETLLATFHGMAFQVSYVLGSLSGLIISLIMLNANLFGRTTAWLRIASSVCDFGLYVPVVGLYISLFSVFFLLAWNILVARRLFQLAR
ncbi:MAG: hypothetical protein CVU44_21490 [Chloroflexi bacterium HGW-Chloroflexi-6]|nr:MAG: hypothetical protein CVU44_21490 [Chloroflexi bacterium HGW-Chloroflexi-6]